MDVIPRKLNEEKLKEIVERIMHTIFNDEDIGQGDARVVHRHLNEKQVAEMTGRHVQTLRNDRSLGRGLPYVKMGRSVRYDLYDVLTYLKRNKITPTEI